MAGTRPERSCDSVLTITLALASIAGCSFDAQGLAPTGETQGSSGSSSGPGSASATSTGPAEPTTSGPTNSASTTGEAGSGSTQPVDPTTGGTTTDPTTGDATTTTTGDDSTTASGSSSTGCAEQPFYRDGDMDGFGDPKQEVMACEQPDGYVTDDSDCNDKDIAVNPDAQEVCMGGDNDCDGKVDEFNPPMNTDCGGCRMVLYQANNRVYHFCKAQRKWDDAKGDCEKRDAILAKDLDMTHHDWLLAQFGNSTGPWFIGAQAINKDDIFTWLDGMVVANDDPRWGGGQPAGGNTNKLALVADNNVGLWFPLNRKWVDRGENDGEPFVCESPFE